MEAYVLLWRFWLLSYTKIVAINPPACEGCHCQHEQAPLDEPSLTMIAMPPTSVIPPQRSQANTPDNARNARFKKNV